MALPDLFTDAQLEVAVGGAKRLLQLSGAASVSDPVYATFKAAVRRVADADVYSLVGPAFATGDTTVQQSPLLAEYSLAIAAYWAHKKGSGGLEIPEGISSGYEEARLGLAEIREGDRALATSDEPTTNLQPQRVDMSANGKGWTRKTWGGFC